MSDAGFDARFPASLLEAVERFVRAPVILVASDFDGTLAPLVDVPSQARCHPQATEALTTLAGQRDTHVAVISGRSLAELIELTRLPPRVHLIGSHGAEYESALGDALTADERLVLDAVGHRFATLVQRFPGTHVEVKPAAAVFHYRTVPTELRAAALSAALEAIAEYGRHLHVMEGKSVVEAAVVGTHKGDAVRFLRQRLGASAVLFIGDDVTDERAFAVLQPGDVAVKVGEGHSMAAHRIDDTDAASALLAHVAQLRSAVGPGPR